MHESENSTGLRHEYQQKFGRNILLFQRMEFLLKFLLTYGQFGGPCSTLAEALKRRQKSVRLMTLGQLVGEFEKQFLRPGSRDHNNEDSITEAHLNFSMKLDMEKPSPEQLITTLKGLVEERNTLVHHPFPKAHFESSDGGKDLFRDLDAQHHRLLPYVEHLASIQTRLMQCLELLQAESFHLFERTDLRLSDFVLLLVETASHKRRPDGWTSLSAAGQCFARQSPEELRELKSKYRCKSLKQLVQETDLFELQDELTEKGGIRTLYRPKPDWQIQRS